MKEYIDTLKRMKRVVLINMFIFTWSGLCFTYTQVEHPSYIKGFDYFVRDILYCTGYEDGLWHFIHENNGDYDCLYWWGLSPRGMC